jgi:hypothetical protein
MRKTAIILLLVTGLSAQAEAQKGEKSIAAGPLISFPLGLESRGSHYKTGLGAEILGQYNVSNRSALLLKITLASWAYKERYVLYGAKRLSFLTLQGGYRYRFGTSGYFMDGLVGVDMDLHDSFTSVSFTLGAGKRLIVNEERFFDVGIDFVGGDAEERLNIKVLFTLFRYHGEK